MSLFHGLWMVFHTFFFASFIHNPLVGGQDEDGSSSDEERNRSKENFISKCLLSP